MQHKGVIFVPLFQSEGEQIYILLEIYTLFVSELKIADMEEHFPSPNFSNPNTEFLAFSSTPIPGANFQPKWGKKNRQENWKRFGQSVSEGGYGSGSHHGGYHPYHKQGGGRWNRGGGHRARGSRGQRGYSGGDYNRGEQSQGWGEHYQNSGGHNRSGNKEEGYFHPAMMRDPWEEMERELEQLTGMAEQKDWDSSLTVEGAMRRELSDSLIPQVEDSLCQRNAELDRSREEKTEEGDFAESYPEDKTGEGN